MKSILVTGSNGQLGSELKSLASQHPSYDFTFVDIAELDITNEQAVRSFAKNKTFHFVINCAAYTAVDKAEEEKAIAEKVNATAVKIIAELCKEKNARLIHISTDYVFDGEFNQPIEETAIPNPLSVYGKTKLEGEKYVESILSDAYIIRTAWVYSTFGKNFVKTIYNLAKQKPELNVVSDQYGSPTYARDLAAAILVIVDSIANGVKDQPGVYHYSNQGAISWFDFAYFIKEHFHLPCRVNAIRTWEYKTAAARPKFSVLDKNKIKTTFGITIPHWSQSLSECLNKIDQ